MPDSVEKAALNEIPFYSSFQFDLLKSQDGWKDTWMEREDLFQKIMSSLLTENVCNCYAMENSESKL